MSHKKIQSSDWHSQPLSHEASVERVFSRTGLLSDPNMDPEYLGMLTAIGVNKKA